MDGNICNMAAISNCYHKNSLEGGDYLPKYNDWLNEDGLTRIRGWARDGFSNEQIAKNMGISRSTLDNWCKEFSDILDAIKKGRAPVIEQVEDAFYKSCIGYWVDEEVTEITVAEDGKERKHKRITRRYIPPVPVSQIFALKNNKPQKWKDKPIDKTSEQYEDDGLIEAIRGGNKLVDDMGMIEDESGV
jgi:hypothetical protein